MIDLVVVVLQSVVLTLFVGVVCSISVCVAIAVRWDWSVRWAIAIGVFPVPGATWLFTWWLAQRASDEPRRPTSFSRRKSVGADLPPDFYD
jgi:hypothetical protein